MGIVWSYNKGFLSFQFSSLADNLSTLDCRFSIVNSQSTIINFTRRYPCPNAFTDSGFYTVYRFPCPSVFHLSFNFSSFIFYYTLSRSGRFSLEQDVPSCSFPHFLTSSFPHFLTSSLQGSEERTYQGLPDSYFHLLKADESHHRLSLFSSSPVSNFKFPTISQQKTLSSRA